MDDDLTLPVDFKRREISPSELIDGAKTLVDSGSILTCTSCDPDWLSCGTYLEWAARGLAEGDEYGLCNCVTYAKRAVCQRIDTLIRKNHLYKFQDRFYPRKLEALKRVDIEIPENVIADLVLDPRNIQEHDYRRAERQQAVHALDLAKLVVTATKSDADLSPIVCINANFTCEIKTGKGLTVTGFDSHPMLFVDIFEDPISVKIVDPSLAEVRFARYKDFDEDQCLQIADLVRGGYERPYSSDIGHDFYLDFKRQSGI